MKTTEERLRYLRKEYLKLSQKDFANKIGMTQGGLCDIEKGRAKLTEKNIKLICSVFAVNEKWLRFENGDVFELKNNDDKFTTAIANSINNNDTFLQSFVNTYDALNENEKKIIEQFILNIAEQINENK